MDHDGDVPFFQHACYNAFGLSGNFDALPSELVFMLFSFLDIKDLCLSTRVSRNWQVLCESPHIWRRICRSRFGCELTHKKKKPSSYHTWKDHCIMVFQCVRCNQQGKRAPAKDEEMCLFNHHRVHVPSLTTYLLLDLCSFSMDQNIDWAFGEEKVGDPVHLQKEGKESWMDLCRSAVNCINDPQPSEEKGETALSLGQFSSPFSVLLQCLVKFENMYLPLAFMNQGLRPAWATAVLVASDCHDVASLIEQLERNISWSAVDNGWREERTPWRTDVMKIMNRKTMERVPQQSPLPTWHWGNTTNSSLSSEEKIRKALIELEQNVAWEAVQQRWRKERHAWLGSLQASTEFHVLMQHLLVLDEVFRDSSFKIDWKEMKRPDWKERAVKGTQEGGINFTQFSALLLELEDNLLGGCFLPNWTFQVFGWRNPLRQMEEN